MVLNISMFNEANENMKWIFRMPIIITNNTKLHTFQLKLIMLIHRIISCNKWLENITNNTINYCCQIYDQNTSFYNVR